METTHLNREISLHLFFGSLFAILLFLMLLITGYRDNLNNATDSLIKIRHNISGMELSHEDLKSKRASIEKTLPAGYSKKSSRELILLTLEKVRAEMPAAKIDVMNFFKEKDEIKLPVVIKFPVSNYNIFVRNIGYLEKQVFPDFMITGAAVFRVRNSATTGEGKIEGFFRMPLEKAVRVSEG